ncbi:macro domain-containing protein [Actinomadura madurae]|uniref:macro domain-containing protein n=1 Tax=Actinomadura madurae TaxID=1993 RepID=UPI001C434F1D|nr:macro domain-containing protein [Actinomadura madurae]
MDTTRSGDPLIVERTGDLLRDDAQALVNPVNTAGVMGKGLALQFKRAYPDNFTAYAKACAEGRLHPGEILCVPVDDRWILNFPTKRHWRSKSRLEDIGTGLEALACLLDERHITSVAIPPLGCGHGGLAWTTVRPLITTTLAPLHVTVHLYPPNTKTPPPPSTR